MALLMNKRWKSADISSGYGMRDNPFKPGEKEMHYGIDVKAEEGTDVTAEADGTVVFSYDNGDYSYGYTVIVEYIDTEGKRSYLLTAHLREENRAKVGQKVKKDDKIGEAGHSGRTEGKHVHVERLIPVSLKEKLVKGVKRMVPYFGDEENKAPLRSDYYENKIEKKDKNGKIRIPTGIPGDLGRTDPQEFAKRREPEKQQEAKPRYAGQEGGKRLGESSDGQSNISPTPPDAGVQFVLPEQDETSDRDAHDNMQPAIEPIDYSDSYLPLHTN